MTGGLTEEEKTLPIPCQIHRILTGNKLCVTRHHTKATDKPECFEEFATEGEWKNSIPSQFMKFPSFQIMPPILCNEIIFPVTRTNIV